MFLLIKINNASSNKKKDTPSSFYLNNARSNEVRYSDFFNSPCPDIEMLSTQGQRINLADLLGRVIILRFTRFHIDDLPYLLYLEHLCKSYAHEGINLFFIYPRQEGLPAPANLPIKLSFPIIEDNGYISSFFQPRLNELIIIGRDLRIKLIDNETDNRLIFSQVTRYLFEYSSAPPPLTGQEMTSLFERLCFMNAIDGKIQYLGEVLYGKTGIINLFVSLCLRCPENQRIALMKGIASRIRNNRSRVILLFGKGNNIDMIKDFFIKNGFMKDFTIGIIQESENLPDKDYYKMFRLDVDPCLYIYKNNEIVFSETPENQGEIDINSSFYEEAIMNQR